MCGCVFSGPAVHAAAGDSEQAAAGDGGGRGELRHDQGDPLTDLSSCNRFLESTLSLNIFAFKIS